MAIIPQYRTWNKIQTKQEVNTETGKIEVFAIGSGLFGVDVLIASSEGKGSDWKLNNPQSFTDVYNRRNNTKSSVKELVRAFFLEGYKVFNNDRAAVLNNSENYDDQREGIIARQRFFNQGTPLLVDPSTQKEVNLEGEKTTQQVTPPVTVENNQTERQEDAPPSSSTANSQVITADNPVVNKEGDSKSIPTPTPKPKIESVGVLRYPLANLEVVEDITGITYDYIKITAQEWVSSMTGAEHNKSAVSRYKETKGNLGTIILPMTNGLGTQNGINWGEGNGNSIQLALAASVGDLITGVANADGLETKIKAAKDSLGRALTSAQGFIDEAGDQKAAVAALLSGYVIGNTSFATRQSGITINPNMELLFSGPQLRSFGFKFDFAPRFREEAEKVREIIRAFKMLSAPVITKTGSIFLETPQIFQLEYIYNGDGNDTADGNTHPYLNKIKPCALTNVSVNYTPGNTYMTYADGGSMVQTTLTLSFKELEPIYNIDYLNDKHPTGY